MYSCIQGYERQYYYSASDPSDTGDTIECLEDGDWSFENIYCARKFHWTSF